MPWYFILLIVLVVFFALSLIGVGIHEAIYLARNKYDPTRQLYAVSSLTFEFDDENDQDVNVLFAGFLVDEIENNKVKK